MDESSTRRVVAQISTSYLFPVAIRPGLPYYALILRDPTLNHDGDGVREDLGRTRPPHLTHT